MYIISLTYTTELAQIERHLAAHREFLDRYYQAGVFLFSGRKKLRTGGIIIARAANRAEIDHIISEDPFFQAPLADYAVTEFIPSKTAPDLAQYAEN